RRAYDEQQEIERDYDERRKADKDLFSKKYDLGPGVGEEDYTPRTSKSTRSTTTRSRQNNSGSDIGAAILVVVGLVAVYKTFSTENAILGVIICAGLFYLAYQTVKGSSEHTPKKQSPVNVVPKIQEFADNLLPKRMQYFICAFVVVLFILFVSKDTVIGLFQQANIMWVNLNDGRDTVKPTSYLQARLLGKWQSTGEGRPTFEFLSDGRYCMSFCTIYHLPEGVYTIIDDKHIRLQRSFIGEDGIAEIVIDGDVLQLTFGPTNSSTWKRVE
ncbi:MAG: hypothetical protein KA069_02475, partial [Candidatus Saccharimonas sp.]|nr:hypothetical protein [Candidatus Saccharimonas sp.]